MKTIYHLFILTLLATAFVGCNGNTSTTTDGVQALELEVGLQQASTRATMVAGTSFTHDSRIKIAIFATDVASSTSLDKQVNYVYKAPVAGVTGAWVPATTANTLALSDWSMSLLAHYPATAAGVDWTTKALTPPLATDMDFGDILTDYNTGNSYWLTLPDRTNVEVFLADDETDYLTGVGTNGPYDQEKRKATILMKHALSMAVFHIAKSPENTAAGHVNSITVSNIDNATGPLRKGAFDLATNGFTPSTDAMSYKRTMSNAPDGCYFGMLTYPATFTTGSVRVTIVVDNQTYSLDMPERLPWQSGCIALYNITISATKAELVDVVMVSDWPELKPENDHQLEIS